MAGPTIVGTTLPDAFVGVPYLAGLPLALATSAPITNAAVVTGGPQGLVATNAGIVSGTIQITSSVGTQIDGPYTATVRVTDVQGSTASANIVINVHYLTADQDLSPAAQAAIRAGEVIDVSTGTVEDAGVFTNVFPTAPVLPTDVG